MKHVKTLPKARVPIVKFDDPRKYYFLCNFLISKVDYLVIFASIMPLLFEILS